MSTEKYGGAFQGFAGYDMEYEQALRKPFVQEETKKMFEKIEIKPKRPLILRTDNPKNNWLYNFIEKQNGSDG